MNRVSGTALAAVLAKYHEERQVIELIITRYANRNLHNQLISLYKTQKDGSIIYSIDQPDGSDKLSTLDIL